MTDHPLKVLIENADRAITAEDFDALMEFYADDAVLVIRPGQVARGKPRIRAAFEAIAAHFGNDLSVKQGAMEVLESGDTALVLMETILEVTGQPSETRAATYVFRKAGDGRWLCAIDNSYGTTLVDGAAG